MQKVILFQEYKFVLISEKIISVINPMSRLMEKSIKSQ